jgi:hypothetical protein
MFNFFHREQSVPNSVFIQRLQFESKFTISSNPSRNFDSIEDVLRFINANSSDMITIADVREKKIYTIHQGKQRVTFEDDAGKVDSTVSDFVYPKRY